MGLAAAREAARQLSERVEAGAPIEPPPSHPRQGGKTVGEVIDLYEKARRKKGGRNKRLDAALRTVRNGLADYLKLPAKQFSKADLREARDRIGKRAPQQADRFRAYLAPIWKWASAEDHIDVNFVPDVLKITSITKRERTLTHDEIQLIWEACGKLDRGDSARAFGRLVKFLLLTGQRRDEGASLKYGHILHGTWRQADNKASRPHVLKLPLWRSTRSGAVRRRNSCFAGVSGKISGFSKIKRELDKVSGVCGWRLHDLRRTAASGMQELGVDKTVIHAVLNHSLGGLAEIYMRAELELAKADACAAGPTGKANNGAKDGGRHLKQKVNNLKN